MDDASLTSLFRQRVREWLGLRATDTEELWRYGLWRAEVKAAAADGSTVDVAPENPRLESVQGVPVRVGIPGAQAVVQAGAIVLLGWERGDPSRPYAVPSWEMGATVTKLVLNADTVILGGEAGATALALADSVRLELNAIAGALRTHKHAGVTTGTGVTGTSDSAYDASDVGATKVKGL
jgi:hypothetical protein